MAELLAERPWPFFIRCDETPKNMPLFAANVATRFKHIVHENQSFSEEPSMNLNTKNEDSPPPTAKTLEMVVYRVVQTFVRRKTEEKSGRKWEDFKDKTVVDEKSGKTRIAIPQEYLDVKRKICADAFLAFRSRRGGDFVDYFTATVGSVAQYLPENDYGVLATALLCDDGPQNRDDVKTLAMLALSAAS